MGTIKKTLCTLLAILMVISLFPEGVAFAEGEAEIYAEAVDYLEQGDLYHAAITFYSIAEYSDARDRSFEIWHQITGYNTLAGKHDVFYAVKNDGTVYKAISYGGRFYDDSFNSTLKDIVSLAVGGRYDDVFVAGLKPDGTVICDRFDCNDWYDIVSITAGANDSLFGIKADGTVVVKGEGIECEGVSDWTDIIAIQSSAETTGTSMNHDVKSSCTVGLKADGSLVATGNNEYGQLNVHGRENIVAISYFNDIVCLLNDGTVEAFGGGNSKNGFKCNEKAWKDVRLICDGKSNICCVDSEGILHSARLNKGDDISVPSWGDVVELWNTYENGHGSIIIGLCKDGTLKFESVSGDEEDIEEYVNVAQESMGAWENIRLPSTYYIADELFSADPYTDSSAGLQWADDFRTQIISDNNDLSSFSTSISGDSVVFRAKVTGSVYNASIEGWTTADNVYRSFDWVFDATDEDLNLFKHVVFQSIEDDVLNNRITPFYAQLWRCGKAISTLADIQNPPNGNIDILLDARDEPQQVGNWIYSAEQDDSDKKIIIHAEYVGNTSEELADISEQLNMSKYKKAEYLLSIEDYSSAIAKFSELGDYSDSKIRIEEINTIQEKLYNECEAMLAEGKIYEAAKSFYAIKNYKDAWDRCFDLWGKLTTRETISTDSDYMLGVRVDGTVVAVGLNRYEQMNVSDWNNIVAVSASPKHSAGLRADGTVVATGEWDNYRNGLDDFDVANWTDIVAISTGMEHTVGLRADGTVIATGGGRSGACDIANWHDIISIEAGDWCTLGVRSDGTVVASGEMFGNIEELSDWSDIVAIAASDWIIGLRSDGTVVTINPQINGVSTWHGIQAVTCGWHAVGLTSNGTVTAVIGTSNGKLNVSILKNIVEISAGGNYAVGLDADGKVHVAIEEDTYGLKKAEEWTDIKLPNP